MTPPGHESVTSLDPPREQEWVAHAALLQAGREAVDDGHGSPEEFDVLETIETDGLFYRSELAVLQNALVSYLGDAPLRDRAPGRALLQEVNTAIERGSPNW